jgi:hypothetical protein
MRRTILLSLFVLFTVGAANHACAQHRGGGRPGFSGGRDNFNHARPASPQGFGYTYLSYDYGYDSGAANDYAPQPDIYLQQPPQVEPPPAPPAPPVAPPPVHPVITEYKWPAANASASSSVPATTSDAEPQTFAIVLKNGSTLSALSVFASDDRLHFVDPDERHLRISMSEVDRAATLKLNRARNLNLYLPAAE